MPQPRNTEKVTAELLLRATDIDGTAAALIISVLVMQWPQAVQLQEIQVPQVVLRLLCSRSVLPELQLQLLHEHRGKQVSTHTRLKLCLVQSPWLDFTA